MCKWGDVVTIKLDNLKSQNNWFGVVEVDKCIAPLVELLNKNGHKTIASCCGHGNQPSSIILEGGKEIRIMTFKQARKVDKLFPSINASSLERS